MPETLWLIHMANSNADRNGVGGLHSKVPGACASSPQGKHCQSLTTSDCSSSKQVSFTAELHQWQRQRPTHHTVRSTALPPWEPSVQLPALLPSTARVFTSSGRDALQDTHTGPIHSRTLHHVQLWPNVLPRWISYASHTDNVPQSPLLLTSHSWNSSCPLVLQQWSFQWGWNV